MNHSDEIRPAIETARLILRTVTMEKIGMIYVGLDEEGGYSFTITKDEYLNIRKEGKPKMSYCKTCELIARRDAHIAPLWDCIHRTPYWDVAHSYNTALPGWLVLVARRHIEAVDELTDEEAVELGILIQRVSLALKETVGCRKTYVIQFGEMAEHPHVHFHIVPRMDNLPEDRRGTKIFEYLNVVEEERVSEEKMNEIALNVRKILLSSLHPSEMV